LPQTTINKAINDLRKLDPEIDWVDLWRSIRGKYRSTRSIDSTFGLSHDSAPRRSTRSTWPTLYLILCICLGFQPTVLTVALMLQ